MGVLGLFRSMFGRSYLPKVSSAHVAAPYEGAGVTATYTYSSGLVTLPISYVENPAGYAIPSDAVAVIRLHQPITTKTTSYANQRHGLPPETFERQQDVNLANRTVCLSSSRSVDAPTFGAQESHGAAFAASGQTVQVWMDSAHYMTDTLDKPPQNGYDGTDPSLLPSMNDYPRKLI